MSDSNFSIELLNEHNKLRGIYGNVNKLELDDELSAKAQEHVEYLASKQSKLENSKDETVGENLYYLESEDAAYSAKHIVDYWIRRSNFDLSWPLHNRNKPTQTNHFTQMIWKNSAKLGVGVAKAENNAVYVAAFYYPRGNVVNHLDENVLFESATETASSSGNNSDSNSGNDTSSKAADNAAANSGKSKEKKLEDKVINTLDKILKKADKEKSGKISLTKAKKVFQLINEKFHTQYTNMDAKKFFEQFENNLEDGKVGYKEFKKSLVDLKLKLPLH